MYLSHVSGLYFDFFTVVYSGTTWVPVKSNMFGLSVFGRYVVTQVIVSRLLAVTN